MNDISIALIVKFTADGMPYVTCAATPLMSAHKERNLNSLEKKRVDWRFDQPLGISVFTCENTMSQTSVYDIDTMDEFRRVKSINVETGEIVMFAWPIVMNECGKELITQSVFYTSIYPIYDGDKPCLFHCYGRIS